MKGDSAYKCLACDSLHNSVLLLKKLYGAQNYNLIRGKKYLQGYFIYGNHVNIQTVLRCLEEWI